MAICQAYNVILFLKIVTISCFYDITIWMILVIPYICRKLNYPLAIERLTTVST